MHIKHNRITTILFFITLLASCSHGFLKDPRLYNPKKSRSLQEAPESMGIVIEDVIGEDPFDKEELLKKDGGGFLNTQFDNWIITAKFDGDNVPEYKFNPPSQWKKTNEEKAEWTYGPTSSWAGSNKITNMYYFQYRGKNNSISTGQYNAYNVGYAKTKNGNPKLERFYFYRFKGDTAMPKLDNCLVAVDTYTKFMWAYAVPLTFEYYAIVSTYSPTSWGSVEENCQGPGGKSYKFWEYDPVGYVNEDGSVVLYEYFKNTLRKAKNGKTAEFAPTMAGHTNDAERKVDGVGKSPYFTSKIDLFTEDFKLLKDFAYSAEGGSDFEYKYTYIAEINGSIPVIKRTGEKYRAVPAVDTEIKVIEYDNEEKEKVFTFEKSIDSENATFKSDNETWTITLKDKFIPTSGAERQVIFNSIELKKQGEENSVIADKNFVYYGPTFKYRVQNKPTYQSSGNKYVFIDGQKKLTWNDIEYSFARTDNDNKFRNRAVYTKDNVGFYGVELSENDTKIKMTLWSSYNVIMWNTLGWDANLVRGKQNLFKDQVTNTNFKLRKKLNDGNNSDTLLTYSFSSDGKTVTEKQQVWRGVEKDIGTYTISDENALVYDNVDYKGLKFSFKTDDKFTTLYITKDGKKEEFSSAYKDNGPCFFERVKTNPEFENGKTKISFQTDSKGGIKMLWNDTEMGFERYEKELNRAVFWKKTWFIYTFFGVELSENDNTLKITSFSGKNAIQWHLLGDTTVKRKY